MREREKKEYEQFWKNIDRKKKSSRKTKKLNLGWIMNIRPRSSSKRIL